jgi:glycosyltransferase involved in cell wall biosynthesis
LKPGFNGVHIDPEDVAGIVRRIRELDDGEDLSRMSLNGIQYARTHFTSDAVRDRIRKIVG